MTDITRLLENPVEATTIVQNVVLLLVKKTIRKKYGKSVGNPVAHAHIQGFNILYYYYSKKKTREICANVVWSVAIYY